MSIRIWSDEYCSSFPDIDEHHKTMFRMLGNFADANDSDNGKVKNHVVTGFLEGFLAYCEKHFKVEEGLMRRHGFPLHQYHEGLHEDLRRTANQMMHQVEKNKLERPFATVLDFSTEWLYNHIVHEDLVFFQYCRNKDNCLAANLINRKCELLTLDNKFLGKGKIESMDNNEIVISNTSGKTIPLRINDMVKLASYSKSNKYHVFIARAFYSTGKVIKLLNATIIKTTNERSCARVPVDLDAHLTLEDRLVSVKVKDAGAGGLMIESDFALEPGQVVPVTFTLQNNLFVESAKIVREIKGFSSNNIYGVHFTDLSRTNAEKLHAFVFNEQLSAKRELMQ